jgi:hypothetical protein
MNISINEDLSLVNIDSKKTYKGSTKSYFSELALYKEDYFDLDKRKFDPDYEKNHPETVAPKTKRISKNTQFKLDEKKRKEEAEEKERIEKKYEKLKEYHEDDFKLSEYKSFNLVSDGRFSDANELIVEESYSSEELINKAGRNYIFNIGSLIGSQFELEDEDMERSSDIHLSFPKSYNYVLKVNIPSGYKVEGIDQLNYNIDNEMGSFISTAKNENGTIIIETTKNYKALNAKKEDWKDFIEFIESAYAFSQKKVIIKKI